MTSKKVYSKSIDIDAEWKHAEDIEIDCLPDDSIIEDKILQQQLVEWPQIRLKTIGISHRDTAVLLSLLGYQAPFFHSSPALGNDKPANHAFFRDELVNSKIHYEWVRDIIRPASLLLLTSTP